MSKSPNPVYKTTWSLNALPSLNGSVGYIFSSCDLNVKGSSSVRLKDMVERFKVYDRPREPEDREEIWQGGKRIDTRDYLLYGRFYIPTSRLDALYCTRLSPTLQAVVASVSDLRSRTPAQTLRGNAEPTGMSNVMFSLQHDTGRWCSEYSWSADDGMWGARVLHNFGRLAGEEDKREKHKTGKRVDEEDAMEGGLKGRWSAGAEFYFSAQEKSAGVSAALRFTTLPDATPPYSQLQSPSTYFPSQPPTTITAIFNPMMGHLSAAYAARVSRDVALCSRFDFNVYSYDSEWTMGTEWWLRKRKNTLEGDDVSKGDDIRGVVKARVSTNTNISLMWEGRLRSTLVSLGVVSDLASRAKPIKAVGLEISYFSSE